MMKKSFKFLLIILSMVIINSCSKEDEIITQETQIETQDFKKLVEKKLCINPNLKLLIRNNQTGEIILEKYKGEEYSKSSNCAYTFNLPQVNNDVNIWPYTLGGTNGDINSSLLQPVMQYLLEDYISSQGKAKIYPIRFFQDSGFGFYSSSIQSVMLNPVEVNDYAEEILCQMLTVRDAVIGNNSSTYFFKTNSRIYSANVEYIDGTICSGEIGIVGNFYLGHQG